MDTPHMLALTVLLGLASYRATHLVVHDTILDPLRDRLHAWAARDLTPLRNTILMLTSCTYCAGWWVSGLLLAAYLTAARQWSEQPLVVVGAMWLAVAGVQAIANRWNDTREEAS